MTTLFRNLPLIALSLVFAGCRTNPATGFADVQQTVGSRTGQTVEWPRTTAESDKTKAAVTNLLGQELTADSAVQVALLNNRALRATLEEIGISRADLLQAGLFSNPRFAASFRFPDRPPSAPNTEYSLTQDFLDLLLLPLRKRVAALQFEQTKLRVSHQILQLASEAKVAFYTVQARQQLLGRMQAIVEVNEAAVDLSLRQHNAGNITDLELANQAAAFHQAKLEWSKTLAQARADRERLNRVLGLWGTNTAWKAADKLPAIPAKEIALENLESVAVTQRLDLVAAQQQVALASRALGLRTNTRYLPASIKLGVDTERGTDRQRVTGPTIDLEVPVFDQGQGAIARLQAQYRQAQWQTEALATDIRSEVRQARDALVAARDLAEFYAKVYLPQRIRIVNETLLQYNAMQQGTFELITAKERELSAEREYTEAWRDYWIARAELEKAVGGRLGPAADASAATNPPEKSSSKAEPENEHNHK
jgi:cobalt-zinc-cadmium efflux system outer membrane protein